MKDGERAKIVFKEELEYIKSAAIKAFTLKCFDELTADYFWDFTASSSQKHHPKVSNKDHGLVIHVKLCVWWGRKLAESFNCDLLDIIISSLLLHDLQKFGKMLDKNKKPTLADYSFTHGPLLAVQIENLYNKANINDSVKDDINTIVACVALHMGIWTNKSLSLSWKELPREIDKQLVDIVHLADYCASRKVDEKIEELDNYKFPGECNEHI